MNPTSSKRDRTAKANSSVTPQNLKKQKKISASVSKSAKSNAVKPSLSSESAPSIELSGIPEVTSKLTGFDTGMWGDAAGSTGRKTIDTEQESEKSVAQELFENGFTPLRSTHSRRAGDLGR